VVEGGHCSLGEGYQRGLDRVAARKLARKEAKMQSRLELGFAAAGLRLETGAALGKPGDR
jgi:hypothetical protein